MTFILVFPFGTADIGALVVPASQFKPRGGVYGCDCAGLMGEEKSGGERGQERRVYERGKTNIKN